MPAEAIVRMSKRPREDDEGVAESKRPREEEEKENDDVENVCVGMRMCVGGGRKLGGGGGGDRQ